jgi:hypothetical protein
MNMKIIKITSILIFVLLFFGCTERSTDDITNSNMNPVPTEIGGNLSATLIKANSPYKIIDNIIVESNSTLTIEHGVKMWFTDSTILIVYGKLNATGIPSDMITFTASENTWKGIKVYNSPQNSMFRFCVFEKILVSLQDSSQYGSLEINGSTANIQNCIFRYNSSTQGGGLSLVNDSSLVTNNIFRENEGVAFGGAILAQESSAQIINNTFYHNLSSNVGGGLVLYDPVAVDIQNNIFFDNTSSYGSTRIELAAGDSSGFNQQYNFLSIGNQDPRFISNANLHLQDGSPCLDMGNPDPAFYDVDNSRNDQGAYGGQLGDW